MSVPAQRSYLTEALRLHQYLYTHHWDGVALTGPDVGVRFNYRIGRFVKSYLSPLPWRDSYYYLQGQGYWVLANWRLFDATDEASFHTIAVAASREMLRRQRADGAWEFPNPEWAGRVPTAEGAWASLGLLETYRRTGDDEFLRGAKAWNSFVDACTGYEPVVGGVAVNYFAGRRGAAVPNNSAFVARFVAQLWQITRDDELRQRAEQLVTFLRGVQLRSGELPYALARADDDRDTLHFQCYQYNAFQVIDLVDVVETTGDATATRIVTNVLAYLRDGTDREGRPYYDCRKGARAVTYHAGALAAAFAAARRIGVDGYDDLARRSYAWLIGRQRDDGGFPASSRDYGFLADRRSYPRNLAMSLLHLLST